MRSAIVLVMLLAACGNDTPGMRLEVLANGTGADHVEIYLAREQCPQCDGALQPARVPGKLSGEVWFLDGDAIAGTPETMLQMTHGSVVIDLHAPTATSDALMPYVVVVGYDAQDNVVAAAKMIDVKVHHDRTDWVKLSLDPAVGQPSSDTPAPLGDRVWVWRRGDATKAACLGFEKVTPDGIERFWFVPEDDPDCDEVTPQLECDGYAFHAMGTATIDAANCTVSDQVPGAPTHSCLLGGPACNEVPGSGAPANTCSRVDPYYCIPDLFCNASCTGTALPVCAANGKTNLACTVPTSSAGLQCTDVPAETEADIDLSVLFATGSLGQATHCTDVRFADLKLMKPSTSTMLVRSGATFSRSSVGNAPCSFKLKWESGTANTTNMPAPALLDVQLDNGRSILLPLLISFERGNCGIDSKLACVPGVDSADGIKGCTY